MSQTATPDIDYQKLEFEYRRSADQSAASPAHHPVVVVGAGPVGLTLAIDLAQRGQSVLLLDDDHKLSTGSRAICFAKRTLEIWDRIGVGQRMVDKGVSWNVGRVFFRDQEVYSFDLLPEPGHERPAFINLQQYYAEGFLVERAAELPKLEIRWKNKVTALTQDGERVTLAIDTPDGPYTITASYVAACDGSRSPLRGMLGQESKGRIFRDRFLIADLKLPGPLFPNDATERWYWFDPPFHRGQSVLLHKQADNVWRIDFQLGWQADPVEERKPENVIPRIKAMLGDEREFELEWVSIYTFQCRRMNSFNHGRVLFVGDAAHQVSPFGARGANSGIQDTDNLAWKLKLVIDGKAPPTLLDTYTEERGYAADENIMNSTRSTDFITPKSNTSKTFRNAVLELAAKYPFARALVNSGRLSVPSWLARSSLNTPDSEAFDGDMIPGAPMADAPVQAGSGSGDGWLLRQLGNRFQALHYVEDASALDAQAARTLGELAYDGIAVEPIVIAQRGQAPAGLKTLLDSKGRLSQRYDLKPGTTYLARPDQHVAARWRALDAAKVKAAVARATGNA